MTSPLLEPERLERVDGFGMAAHADAYVFRPTNLDGVRAAFDVAKRSGRQVVLRGTGLSYGDAAIAPEAVVVDCTRMSRILNWDPASGLIECEPGVSLGSIWQRGIEDGWFPAVTSGTMNPTIGGAVGMNIHGKNAFKAGPIGEFVQEFDLLTTKGDLMTIRRGDRLFHEVIGSAGLLGFVARVVLQMKRVHSGNLRVYALSRDNWREHQETFEEYEGTADYMVNWVDCFARGRHSGRGLFHAAWYMDDGAPCPPSLKLQNQGLPDTIMGLVPKSIVWRFLKPLNNRSGMRFVNAVKHHASTIVGNNATHIQSLVAFQYLLDYVPNWRNAYLPHGFIQYQSFVPKERAMDVFAAQVALQQEHKLESFLGVMKRHKPDGFLLSHAVDGYSLALDFKVTGANRERLIKLCHQMNDLVLAAGGRFYFAKDYTLRPEDAAAYLGPALGRLRELKGELDPGGLLTSGLARRLKLFA